MMINSQRHLFDVPDDIAYFNCAYGAPLLREAQKRMKAGVEASAHPWKRTPESFFEDAEVIRQLSAKLFGGGPDGWAVVPAASYGISTAARAIEPSLSRGDRVLLIAEEFPSIVLPWRRTALESGATIETVTPTNGMSWSDAVIERMERNVKVVAISTCHWTDGALIDVKSIGRACKEKGIVLVIDATQFLGAVPLSIEKIQPDFLVAAGYKWLLFPYGVSLLYVAERWRNSRPLEESWLARDNAADFSSLATYSMNYMMGARRFEVGEKCTPALLPGAIAALEQINTWGVENICESLAERNAQLGAGLEHLGFLLPAKDFRSPHMFGARMPKGQGPGLIQALHQRNVFLSLRGDAVRLSPHLYNDHQDVARLLEAFEAESR